MCRALKSYFRSIGMIPSCRIQSLINQQSYTECTIARWNSAHAMKYSNLMPRSPPAASRCSLAASSCIQLISTGPKKQIPGRLRRDFATAPPLFCPGRRRCRLSLKTYEKQPTLAKSKQKLEKSPKDDRLMD